jgi:hypothetical protein
VGEEVQADLLPTSASYRLALALGDQVDVMQHDAQQRDHGTWVCPRPQLRWLGAWLRFLPWPPRLIQVCPNLSRKRMMSET